MFRKSKYIFPHTFRYSRNLSFRLVTGYDVTRMMIEIHVRFQNGNQVSENTEKYVGRCILTCETFSVDGKVLIKRLFNAGSSFYGVSAAKLHGPCCSKSQPGGQAAYCSAHAQFIILKRVN